MKLDFETNTSTVNFVDHDLVNDVKTETSSAETMQMLRDGIKAAQNGNRAEARQLLLRVTDAEPKNENAWLWLASISEYPEELLIFLNNVLTINPANERALEWAGATKTLLSKTFVQRGIDASKETHTDFAKQCFLQAIVHDTQNEMAWLWLASVCDSVEEKAAHLQKVLNINPANETAATLLNSAKRQMSEAQMQKAIAAAVADDHTNAHRLLQEVMRQTPELEDAWVLKSFLANSFSDKVACFKKILEFNPDNGLAQVSLISLLGMMAKAEAKPENDEHSLQVFDSQETPMTEAVSDIELSEDKEDVELSEDKELESYFAEAAIFEELENVEENHLVEKSEEENIPTQELELAENEAAEENYVETQDETNIDVPELEFDAAEMNEAIELENLEDDFYGEVEHSPVELESAMTEGAETFETSADEVSETVEFMESPELDGEFEEQMEFAEENFVSDEFRSDEESLIAGYNEQSFADYSEQTSEMSHEEVSSQSVAEDDLAETQYSFQVEAVEDVVADQVSTEHVENVTTDEETTEHVENVMADADSPQYVEVVEEMFASNNVAENDYDTQTDEDEQYISAEETSSEETFVEQSEVEEQIEEKGYEFHSQENSYHFQPQEHHEENGYHHQVQSSYEENGDHLEAEEHHEENGFYLQTENQQEENADKTTVEKIACPFCNAENEPTAFVCNWCHAMLSISDLEMLLAHQEVNTEMLANAVERMEVEKNLRDFSSDELKFLGIGQINLKNLRQGYSSLQAASKLNPNDIVLSAQVNALAIRLSEIEQQESVHSSMPKNRTILVVDDSATVRKLVSGKLEKCGHEVVCAIDGVDALEKINALVPDLILLDITMPRMDGYQVCKLIRNNEATKDVPIVMISGKDGFFDKVRGRMAGTTGYITKPFGPETLMKTVEAYIV